MHEATISVNAVCNLRCRVCAIWRNRDSTTIDPDLYRRLPSSLKKVTLTGGEPLLDAQLESRIRVIHETCPSASIVLITNGSLPAPTEESIRKVRPLGMRIGVRVSIDGPREIHDRLRGREGAYDLAVDTLRRVQAAGIHDLGISYTVQPENIGTAHQVAALARELGVEFICNVVQNSDLYYGTHDNRISPEEVAGDLERIRDFQLRSPRWKEWFRAYFTQGLAQYHQTGRTPFACLAGHSFFYLHHDGGVYPCNILDECLGNIRDETVQAILSKPENRDRIASFRRCRLCWTSCNASDVMRHHPVRLAAWVAVHKARSLIAPR
ncbi:radical SAM protein [Candidatus Sumerlaeota bacterium]|nr:radical SAM protein [Candidatus Sumerlaeota bacterium]